jgi:rhodanese-related sulfurtransferase
MIRGSGRTDFQQGDPRALYRSVRSRIFSLPETCLLYPAHDYRGLTATSVAEEKKFNPRLGGEVGEGDYVGYMKNLDLPHPKKIDEAVPANLRCGQPGNESAAPPDPHWAPLRFTFGGVWEVEPHWLEENLAKVQVLDVREPNEFTGPLGHIRGATLVPLGELAQRAKELPNDKPIVAVCRAGSRSAHATAILQKAGFSDIANLPGGMRRWQVEGRGVEGGAPPALRLRRRHRIAVLPQQVLHALDAVAVTAIVAIEARRLARHVRAAGTFALAGRALVPVGQQLRATSLGLHLGLLAESHDRHCDREDHDEDVNTTHRLLLQNPYSLAGVSTRIVCRVALSGTHSSNQRRVWG